MNLFETTVSLFLILCNFVDFWGMTVFSDMYINWWFLVLGFRFVDRLQLVLSIYYQRWSTSGISTGRHGSRSWTSTAPHHINLGGRKAINELFCLTPYAGYWQSTHRGGFKVRWRKIYEQAGFRPNRRYVGQANILRIIIQHSAGSTPTVRRCQESFRYQRTNCYMESI